MALLRWMVRLVPEPFRPDLLLLSVVTVAFLSACATFSGSPGPVDMAYTETGYASWYGPGFHGRQAANGEIYDQHALTAAHRTLPFGTLVEVTRRDTGDRVVVRITDRGPFVRGRIIDLSHEAARELGSIGPGVVPVRLRIAALPDAAPLMGIYTVQLGKFQDPERARALYERLGVRIPGLRLVNEPATASVKVVTRPYTDYRRAERVAWRIRRDLQPDAFVVAEPMVGKP
jgi:peptidoglycan lytic transglycosylase